MDSSFKYSCTIYGHNGDVREIIPSPLQSTHILSASRDKTARLWAEDSDGSGYHQKQCFEGHTNFTSSVTAVGPTDEYPDGLVFTGSSDKIIRIYSPLSSLPIAEFGGHTDTVCTLEVGQVQMLISGSWDKTARVWIYKKKGDSAIEGKQALKLEGHSAAVWAVLFLQQGKMATGSADKTIKLWKAGKCIQTLEGHEDCVRNLASISDCQFLSCANDATVRRWTTDGDCLQVYYGHTNYVYSVATLPNMTGFATCGEDRTLKLWKMDQSDAAQTITLPAQSGWSVAVLQNGDVAVALSDSTIRIFTQNAERIASEASSAAYECEVTSSLSNNEEKEEIDEKNVKPSSALELPGAKDGQVIMIRNGDVIEAHQWSENDTKWTKVGDVVSASNKKAAHRKTMHNGKEYDFVFDVDIKEGAPALKLPYNVSEDPWFAAQKFIDDNDLSQYFLDEICNFIMDNTKEARKNFQGGGRYVPGNDATSGGAGEDPFTGGGRYMPGSGDNEIQFGGGAASDPIMNPDRYIPGDDFMDTSLPSKQAGVPATSITSTTTYFPKEGFITFSSSNVDAILGKLSAFSEQLGGLTEADIEALKGLLQPTCSDTSGVDALWKILQWPTENLLPALDILRIACLQHEHACKKLCSGTSESDEIPKLLLEMLCRHITTTENTKPANVNRLLSLRSLCNMFKFPDGSAFLMAGFKDIFQALSSGFSLGLEENTEKSSPFFGNKNVQIAASSLLLNYSVLLTNSRNVSLSAVVQDLSSAVRSSCVEVAIVHLVTGENLSDPESTFRYLVCLGTLISGLDDTWVKEAKALGADKVVETAGAIYSNVPKIFECTKCLSVLLFE